LVGLKLFPEGFVLEDKKNSGPGGHGTDMEGVLDPIPQFGLGIEFLKGISFGEVAISEGLTLAVFILQGQAGGNDEQFFCKLIRFPKRFFSFLGLFDNVNNVT